VQQEREDSKNIPKNYSRAIYQYITAHSEIVELLIKKYNINLKEMKKTLNEMRKLTRSIKDLRNLWVDNPDLSEGKRKINKILRMFAFKFLREEAITYFFQCKKYVHISPVIYHRQTLIRALKWPE
jgi:hypothetical protein